MRILLINQFVPPDEAPTSRLLGELGDALQNRGWDVEYLGGANRYRSKALRGWRRWLRDVGTHARVLWHGLLAKKPDIILCLTDPPALVFTSALIASLRGCRLAHWAMDVYPEIAGALGELKPGSPIYGLVRSAAMFGYDRCDVIGCLDADMAEALSLSDDPRRHDCAPWPPTSLEIPAQFSSSKGDRLKVVYSGNLGRAHDYETLLRAQRILEDRDVGIDLVFQGGGPNRERAMELASTLGLKNCHWLDYAADDEFVSSLMEAHMLVATQRPETRGLLWPSKLALMLLLPKPVLWVGPQNGAIAQMLRERDALTGVFTPGESEALAEWLIEHRADCLKSAVPESCRNDLVTNLKARRLEEFERWHHRLSAATFRP